MTEHPVRQLPQCDRCLNNSHNPHLFCAIHSCGVPEDQSTCLDWEEDTHCPEGEWWEPEGGSFYGDELVISSHQRWTRMQQLELLMWHPVFTGLCPQCRHEFPPITKRIHWDCPECQWRDGAL
ncbi:MAG TPA: hypothetical protein V6C84_12195 [Coleofasciculaceae cyanobacterium]